MSARIAPDAVGPDFGASAEYRSRPPRVETQGNAETAPVAEKQQAAPAGTAAAERTEAARQPLHNLPDLPAPAPPPGEAFATALISGQLPPRPTSEAEAQLRLGSAKMPAQGSLPLTDRLV